MSNEDPPRPNPEFTQNVQIELSEYTRVHLELGRQRGLNEQVGLVEQLEADNRKLRDSLAGEQKRNGYLESRLEKAEFEKWRADESNIEANRKIETLTESDRKSSTHAALLEAENRQINVELGRSHILGLVSTILVGIGCSVVAADISSESFTIPGVLLIVSGIVVYCATLTRRNK